MLKIIQNIPMLFKQLVLFISLSPMLCSAAVTTPTLPSTISVQNAYIRATIPGVEVSSAYMRISNHGKQTVRLIGVTSQFSPRIEMHEHSMANGMMKMRQVPYIEIANNSTVELQPYGYHLMIFGLQKPLTDGEQRTMVLHFDNEQQIQVKLPVQSIKKQHEE